jgi:4-amino-4-deoxy-L-arabinose transferase-like glycosyltransferase
MPEITKTKSQRPKTENRLIWYFFAFAVVFVYFFALGSFPLVGPDEPRYAQVAREMFERNDFVTPTLGGFNWFEKPVLLYWLQIAFYKIFGVSEFSARLGSALFGLGTIASLYLLGKFTAEDAERAEENKKPKTESPKPKTDFANWLAVIAASSIGLLVFSRGASFDIILTFPVTAALVAFFIFDQSEKKSVFTFHFSLFTFHFFIGVALLAKGLVGIVFPYAIVSFYYLLSWRLPNKTFIFSLIWGTILSLLVASVWYLPMYQTHGWTFVDEFFIQHHFQRYTSNKYQHPQPFYFFFWVLPLMTLPWLPFFLASIWNFIKAQSSKLKAQSQNKKLSTLNSQLSTFAFAWLLVPLVFFSFSGSKLPGYILPALPAALVLTAEYVYRFIQKSSQRRIFVQVSAFLTFAVVALLLQFAAPRFADGDSVKNLIKQADEKGFAGEKITNLFTVSHNAEFYAAGRLIRDDAGKLKRYDNFQILVEELKRSGAPRILVFVPHDNTKHITESPLVESEILGDNGETAIVSVKAK